MHRSRYKLRNIIDEASDPLPERQSAMRTVGWSQPATCPLLLAATRHPCVRMIAPPPEPTTEEEIDSDVDIPASGKSFLQRLPG